VQVITETKGAVKLLRLARPEKKNALTAEMYDALTAGLREAAADSAVRAVLLIGAPGVFTAGNDLSDFLQHPPTGDESPVFRFLNVVTNFEKPLVAAVDGPAVGIGTTLLLHCDLVVAATGARFQLPFVKLGLVPEAASSYLLPRLAGMQRASEWLLLGEPFSAADAHAAGLVNRVIAAEALESTALAFAEALAARPPEAVRLSKQLIRAPRAAEVAKVMEQEGALFVERLASDEAREAFMAFLARKKG
jgi:enoyl-CoA hydratase/carnithine racemase